MKLVLAVSFVTLALAVYVARRVRPEPISPQETRAVGFIFPDPRDER